MRKVICFLFLSVIYFGAAAQAPDSLSFQAVIRGDDGSLLADQSVSARIGIYQGSENGTKIFEETHAATTNSNGLLTLLIGGGTNVTGDLAAMDWGAGPYFIKREIDPNGGTDYVISGTSQFLSVPYALYAASGGAADDLGDHTATQDLDMNGNAITEKSSASTPLTLEVKLNDQDMQLTSYDEIYITTIEGSGNDPDGNPYSTYGDIELTSADDIFIKSINTVVIDSDSDDITIDADNNLYLIADDDNVEITANDKVIISSGTGDNITLSSDNDIELIANPASDDYVEIWYGRDEFLYTLPNTRGEDGQILIREGTATGATSERYTTWTPYKFPLLDGSSGQVLQTDGSGNVTWATASGGGTASSSPVSIDSLTDAKFGGTNFTGSMVLGRSSLSSISDAQSNYGFGEYAFFQLTTGDYNVSLGTNALFELTTGSRNIAIGYNALTKTVSGVDNVGIGDNALWKNTGSKNIAIGTNTLKDNTTGETNTVIGNKASTGSTGSENVYVGAASGGWDPNYNKDGNQNVGIGNYSLGGFAASLGTDKNVAIGYYALKGAGETGAATSGPADLNVAVGYQAGRNLTTGSGYTIVGAYSSHPYGGTFTGSNVGLFGTEATPSSVSISNEITLGNSAITALRCQVTSITALSDRRDKKNIRTISEGIDFVKKLNPVIFDWNQRDGNKVDVPAAGFIAQDLLELQNKSEIGEYLDLVSTNNPDKLEARYNNLLPVLVKAIQEQQAVIETLKVELKSSREVNEQLIDKYENLEASVYALTKSLQNLNIQSDKVHESEDKL